MAERDGADTRPDTTDTGDGTLSGGGPSAEPPTGVSPTQRRSAADAGPDPVGPGTAEQPWHPFEQPSWLDASADPRVTGPGGFLTSDGADFMGVSRWDGQEAEIIEERRRPWLLGALAAVAVVIVLAVIAFFAVRSGADATPGQGAGTVVVTAPTTTAAEPAGASADPSTAAAVVPTVTDTPTSTAAVSDTAASDTATSDTDTADPLGGPQRDIACAPGYVVQIASGGDEASFTARVAELRAAGQLPADALVARTASSCAIFAGQANSIVLYTGPYTGEYDGCGARLTGAPDSFIKGTTPETASTYVSCLCPVQVVTIPTVDAIGRAGVWIGELQRVLANRLNIPIPDLPGNWGTFTDGTSAAVTAFQTGAGLPVTGTVDAVTWQALQQAEC